MQSLQNVSGREYVCVCPCLCLCVDKNKQLDHICMQGGFREKSATTLVWGFYEYISSLRYES